MAIGSQKKQVRSKDKAAIVSKAVCKAADLWDIDNKSLSEILGISPSSVSRLRHDLFHISENTKEWELAMMFLRVYRGLDAYMGGQLENEKLWLNSRNTALNGVPIEMMQNIVGLANTVQYVDCMRGR